LKNARSTRSPAPPIDLAQRAQRARAVHLPHREVGEHHGDFRLALKVQRQRIRAVLRV